MTYTTNQSNEQQILEHFKMCESNFYENLKNRVNIAEYAQKLYLKSTRYEAWDTWGGANTLVGLICYYENDKNVYITNVSVVEQCKHNGIGTNLMNMLIQNNQDKIFELEVDLHNKNAISFYAKFNFEAISLKMKRNNIIC